MYIYIYVYVATISYVHRGDGNGTKFLRYTNLYISYAPTNVVRYIQKNITPCCRKYVNKFLSVNFYFY